MSITIDLVLDGKGAVSAGMKDVATALRDLQKGLNSFVKSAGNVGKASSGAARNINAQANAAQRASGVMSRLIKAQQDYNKAVRSGNAVAITDAHSNLLKAQKGYANYQKQANPAPQPSQLASYLGQMIGTTRVGVGKFSPLISKMIPGGTGAITGALDGLMGGAGMGAAGAAGPVGIAVAAGVTAIKLLGEAAKQAAAMLNEMNSARASTGASMSSLGQGMGFASALGMSPEQYAQAANQFADSASHGGYAESDARRMGVRVSPNQYERSNEDVMADFNRAVRSVMTMKDDKEAMAIARRNPALQAAYEARSASDGVKQQVLDSMQPVSKEDLQAAKDFQIEQGLISKSWNKIVMSIGKPILDAVAPIFADISKALDTIPKGALSGFVKALVSSMPVFQIISLTIKGISWWTQTWHTAMDALAKKIMAFLNMINPAWGKRAKEAWNQYQNGGDGKNAKDAIDTNTRAVNENTREMKNQREVLGGGNRARSAMPAAWRYEQMDAAMHSQAARLGAF